MTISPRTADAVARTVPLRRSILLVAVAGIIPVAIAAALALWASVMQAERATEAKTAEVTRIAASAIELELQQSLSALERLASSPLLDEPPDLPRFRSMIVRFAAATPGWVDISLAEPDQTLLLDTKESGLRSVFEQSSFLEVVRSGHPVIGPLVQRPGVGWSLALRVPVVRDGRVLYVLNAIQTPDVIRAIVDGQGLPADWVMSVFDAKGLRVARSKDHEANLGGAPAPSLTKLMSSGANAGSGITYTIEGTRGYTAFVRLPETGWSVALSIPTATVWGGALRSAAVYFAGLMLALILAIVMARASARRIAEPIAALSESAARADGGVPELPRTRIREIQALGHALVTAAVARRLSEEKSEHLAAERNALLESERAARTEAVRMGQLKDQFLATLSHELRTPLNSILGWAEILRRARAGEADRAQGLETIERNARAQARLVEELLDVNRIASGKVQLDLQQIEAATLLRNAIDIARPAAAGKGVHLAEELDFAAGPITADPARLQQIVGNLLGNAIKFTPRGGTVRVKLVRAEDAVRIVVADTGQGIAPEFLPSVFDRFRQADASTTRQHGGLGLGLSIVRDLVALHGGTVRAESAGLGQGATFTVELPLAVSDPAILHSPLPAFSVSDLRGVGVLVVDDDEDARLLAVRLLEEASARVLAVDSADSALAALKDFDADVVVSDISMPGVDGYEFVRLLRSREDLRAHDRPVIALTAFARSEDRQRILASGFAAHVTKPVDPGQLTSQVARLATRRREA